MVRSKGAQTVRNIMENERQYKREGILSTVVNVVLFVAKYSVGYMTGSIAIVADGWHSLSDSLSSIIVWVSAKMSGAPPDEKHPFGHGRIEAISSIMISILLFVVAYDFVKKSIENFANNERIIYGIYAYIVIIISIIFKEALTFYATWIYKKTKSNMMKAEASHHRSDSLSSAVLLSGILFGRSFWWIDSVLGIFIALMIAYTAFSIIKDVLSTLIGESPDEADMKKIKSIIREETGMDLHSHHFHVHNYGDHKELTFHIRLDGKLTLDQTHCITEKIEKRIKADTGFNSTIHPENG